MVDWDSLVTGPTVGIFGEAVLYQPLVGGPFVITGVFDESYLEMLTTDGLMAGDLVNTRPLLGVQLSQFVVPPLQDDVLTILRTGRTYWVNEVRDDGHGSARLLLNNAPGVA